MWRHAFGECMITDSKRSEEEVAVAKQITKNLLVMMRLRDTPVPIPNTTVKT